MREVIIDTLVTYGIISAVCCSILMAVCINRWLIRRGK